jgi:hypothetical protein
MTCRLISVEGATAHKIGKEYDLDAIAYGQNADDARRTDRASVPRHQPQDPPATSSGVLRCDHEIVGPYAEPVT